MVLDWQITIHSDCQTAIKALFNFNNNEYNGPELALLIFYEQSNSARQVNTTCKSTTKSTCKSSHQEPALMLT